jgi:hypothetical protein
MSKALASLVGKADIEVSRIVARLEELSGWPSEDVRLVAEVKQTLNRKLAQLGLDPHDTTSEELYHALIARYAADTARIDRSLGLNDESSLSERSKTAVSLVERSVDKREVWVLKNTATKALLKQNPPKKLMKKLPYRSIDSMLKREDAASLFIGADLVESTAWHKKMDAKLVKLSTASYELKPLRLVSIQADKLADCQSPEGVIVNGAVGAVALSPSLPVTAPVLTLALMLIDGLEILSENQLSHRLHTVHPVLNWWLETEQLVYSNQGQPVSLNFKDVAQNHLASKDYQQRASHNGHKVLWSQLMQRYKLHIDELPQEIASAEQKAAKIFQPALQLVPELVEAD